MFQFVEIVNMIFFPHNFMFVVMPSVFLYSNDGRLVYLVLFTGPLDTEDPSLGQV